MKRTYVIGNISGVKVECDTNPTIVRADNAKQAIRFQKGTKNYCHPYKAKKLKSYGLAGGIPAYKVFYKCPPCCPEGQRYTLKNGKRKCRKV